MLYYNDFDAGSCAWLGELAREGHLPAGKIDNRSIVDVQPDDLAGFKQCHFFAGIGGWPLALRLAGWPDDREVWTGSAPCQPFSVAGRGRGYEDDRHLAPTWLELIRQRRPATLFGEQVASAAGRDWLSDLRDELEAMGYAVGAADLCAASVGAPHIRQRLFFGAVRLADANDTGLERRDREHLDPGGREEAPRHTGPLRIAGRLEHPESDGWIERGAEPSRRGTISGRSVSGQAGPYKSYADWFGVCWHPECRDSDRSFCDCNTRGAPAGWAWDVDDGWVADADGRNTSAEGLQRSGEYGQQSQDGGTGVGLANAERNGQHRSGDAGATRRTEPANGGSASVDWRDADWLGCRDGKFRPVEPGTFPLAHGVSGRVGLLRGYGNAIVPQVAAEFIKAFSEAAGIRPVRLTPSEDLFG